MRDRAYEDESAQATLLETLQEEISYYREGLRALIALCVSDSEASRMACKLLRRDPDIDFGASRR